MSRTHLDKPVVFYNSFSFTKVLLNPVDSEEVNWGHLQAVLNNRQFLQLWIFVLTCVDEGGYSIRSNVLVNDVLRTMWDAFPGIVPIQPRDPGIVHHARASILHGNLDMVLLNHPGSS